MGSLTSFILFFAVAAMSAAHLQGEKVLSPTTSPSMAYWQEKLPTTPIPQTLKELISYDKVAVKYVGTNNEKGKGVGVVLARCIIQGSIYAAATAQTLGDPSVYMFLLKKDLVVGTKVSLTFVQAACIHKHFIPRIAADKLPFSSDKLSLALKELNVAPDSIAACSMNETLQACETPAGKGETKFCATSLESMIDIITSKMGNNRLTLLSTKVSKREKSVKQEYTIMRVKDEGKEEAAPVYYCHNLQYPYAVYLCHNLRGTRVARVWVKGEDGRAVEAAAICHMDTSSWNPDHASFKILNVKPGHATSICHFAPQGDVLWLKVA